jgi:hypothetical protein
MGARFAGEASAGEGLDPSATAVTVVDAEAEAAETAGASVGGGAASGEKATMGAWADTLGSGTACAGGNGATVCAGTGVWTTCDSGGDGSARGGAFADGL